MNKPRRLANAASTLPEALIAVVLVATFFASIFELNAVCLRCIDASKESLAAVQSVQDRSEVLRNLAFSDLTNTSFVQNLMNTAANPAPFSAIFLLVSVPLSGANKIPRIAPAAAPANTLANTFPEPIICGFKN